MYYCYWGGLVKESIESLAHKRYLRSTKGKTQISRDNGRKRPVPVTDSAISNTSDDDEELGEDLGDLDDLLAEEALSREQKTSSACMAK